MTVRNRRSECNLNLTKEKLTEEWSGTRKKGRENPSNGHTMWWYKWMFNHLKVLNFFYIWTNVQQLITAAPPTPTVPMSLDHFSAHVIMDIAAMVKHVKVRVGQTTLGVVVKTSHIRNWYPLIAKISCFNFRLLTQLKKYLFLLASLCLHLTFLPVFIGSILMVGPMITRSKLTARWRPMEEAGL